MKRFETEPKTGVQRQVTEKTTREETQRELGNRREDKTSCSEVSGANRKTGSELLNNESDGPTDKTKTNE